MAPEKLFCQLSLRTVNFCLKFSTFSIYFILYNLQVWIWIRFDKAPEYGPNMDPDPQHWFGQSLK